MPSPSTPAPPQAWSLRWIIIVLAVLAVAAAIAGHWLGLRSARTTREAIARRETTPPPSAVATDPVAARALANYLVKLQAQVRDHELTFTRLQKQNALTWNIHQRADIERDRQMIRDFLETNTQLTDGLEHGADFIRAEMASAKMPDTVRDTVLALYAKTQDPLLPLQMRMRQCDDIIGENALNVLDLLDLHWGTWTRDEATGRIDFESTITLAAYKDYVGKIAAAAADRQDAERDLKHSQDSQQETPPPP